MIGYDCVRHFDPKAFEGVPDVASPLDLPEAALMVCDTVIAFDHLHKSLQIVTHVVVNRANPMLSGEMERQYEAAVGRIRRIESTLSDLTAIKEPPQPPIVGGTPEATSNIGREGYEAHVARLKQHIVRGDIIQAVPSQRLTRPTTLHPFNAYRHLRRLNPSPYMFYVDCGRGLQLVGASPECLCKVDGDKVYNHAIAGTIKRGATAEGALSYCLLSAAIRLIRAQRMND